MSTVSELIVFADEKATIRDYIDISDSVFSDTILELWFDACVEQADLYLEADFDALPQSVKLGIYEYLRAVSQGMGYSVGLRSSKVGDVSESYAPTPELVSAGIQAAKVHWRLYKEDPLSDGK